MIFFLVSEAMVFSDDASTAYHIGVLAQLPIKKPINGVGRTTRFIIQKQIRSRTLNKPETSMLFFLLQYNLFPFRQSMDTPTIGQPSLLHTSVKSHRTKVWRKEGLQLNGRLISYHHKLHS